ncbi:hypothetical protein OIU84_016884, partial [Salix udensis]
MRRRSRRRKETCSLRSCIFAFFLLSSLIAKSLKVYLNLFPP